MVLVLSLSITACDQSTPLETRAPDRQLEGTILLWHDWTGVESPVLNSLLQRFQQIHPEVTVISLAVPPEQLVETFTRRVEAGLGPDVMLIDGGLVYDLAQAGLLKDMALRNDIDTSIFLNAALSTVRDGERLYGLPFSIHTQVLYYNRSLTGNVPTTLDEWVAEASNERRVAFNTNLAESFWGVRAFGGRMFNEQGEWALAKGGFINWLDFLKTLQASPGFLLDNDNERLQTLFQSGEAAFYIGSSRELPRLLAELGEENLGVAVLPSGPNQRPAGPTLQVSAFVFSRVASLQETNRALELVKFMTNLQQQTRLTIQPIGRLPAHSQIRFRQTLSPLVTELAAQSRTAAPIAFEYRPIWNALVRGQTEMNDLYLQGLSGVLPSHQVVQQISARIVSAFNLEVESTSLELLCPVLEPGAEHEVTLWHSEENEDATSLALLARNFSELCPGITLQLITQNSGDVETRYRRAALAGNGPDMLLASSRLAARLAAGGLIQDLSEYVDIDYLQQFIPEAEAALRYNGRLYGLPESVSVQALYYNTNLVDDPLLNLNEVQIRVSGERQFALPVSFFLGYWGIGAFGGIGFDRETGHILNSDGLMNWLAWLESAQNQPGMVITADFDQAEGLFARGEAAYFISGPWSLSRLRRELGEENFRVALLRAGPGGPGSPILQVQGLMVNRNSPPTATTIAVAFAKYLVSPASQQVMLRTGTHVSPLVTVDLSEHPTLNSFREQAKVSAVVPETSYFAGVEQAGNELFETVLEGEEDLPEAIETFMKTVTRTTDGQVMEN